MHYARLVIVLKKKASWWEADFWGRTSLFLPESECFTELKKTQLVPGRRAGSGWKTGNDYIFEKRDNIIKFVCGAGKAINQALCTLGV